jgi:PAS domain S-box-containing protein
VDDIAQVVARAAASAALLPVGVIVLAPDGTCAYAGGRWCELTGLSADACDGWGWMCATSPEHRSEVLAWIEESGTRSDLPLAYQSTSGDGLVRWARGLLRPVVSDGGEVVAHAGTIQDVTVLAESEARYRQLAEDPSNAIVRVDRSGTVTYVSPVFRMLGHPAADHTGVSMARLVHPDDLHLFADRDSLFENPDEIRHRRFRLIRLDGQVLWVDGRSHGAVDPVTGQVNEIQTSLRDVTEQVEIEQALRESEERFRVLTEAAAEGVCISDGGTIVSANTAFGSLFGYSSDELVGMPASAFISPTQFASVRRSHVEQEAVSGEFTAVRKDGSRFPAYGSSRLARYQGRSVRVIAVTDLTALKLSLALEERRRIARDLHDGLAHELAFIASKTHTARRCAPSPEVLDALESAADRALDEARRAISVLSSREPPPLPVAISQTAEDLCSRAELTLALEVDEEIRVPAEAEENLLRILREAITNAGRHGEAEKVTVRLWRDSQVHLSIEDDGHGFDASLPTRGFGLVSMSERARAVGASLEVVSMVGQGARVEVSL